MRLWPGLVLGCFLINGCKATTPGPTALNPPTRPAVPAPQTPNSTPAMVIAQLPTPTPMPSATKTATNLGASNSSVPPPTITSPSVATSDGEFASLRATYDQRIKSATTGAELQSIDSELAALEVRQTQGIVDANTRLDSTQSQRLNVERSSIGALRSAIASRTRGDSLGEKAAQLNLGASQSAEQNQGPMVTQDVIPPSNRR